MTKSPSPHAKIVIGLPNLQDQIRLVDRLAVNADEAQLERLRVLGHFLAELYAQLQQQKQVTFLRFSAKSRLRTSEDRKSIEA